MFNRPPVHGIPDSPQPDAGTRSRPIGRVKQVLSDTAVLPLLSRVAVTQRAYIKPGTTTGADPDKLLTSVVVFRPGP
jgi:hypothetical protein